MTEQFANQAPMADGGTSPNQPSDSAENSSSSNPSPKGVGWRELRIQIVGGSFAEGGWRSDAACRDIDPEVFFQKDDIAIESAKRICGQCAVQMECLDFAIANREEHGIWGGTSEKERRQIWKRLRTRC
ncbi:MAG TPA: WhiB family transcriptional regulator [Candidatus Saccharimonadales bacterium]|nr:WhiB family transcriptional regulator [Candidatus Saccharimonadales bacterium]